MTKAKWWVSTDLIGKPGSPKVAGPFSTREDAFAAREALEAMGANLSVFEEEITPAVDLPTEPTLGWADANFGRRLIMTTGDGRGGVDVLDQGYVDSVAIRSFVPAVAVPESALTALRGRIGGLLSVTVLVRRIDTFLAAVDAANGDPR